MPRLILASAAIDDLQRVQHFLAERSVEAAARAKTVILEHLDKVQRFPTIYKPVPSQPNRRDIVMTFGSYGYVMRYEYDAAADTVVILRLWHQRENR